MGSSRNTRRLAAILVADVVDYSSFVEVDEAGALSMLVLLHRQVVAPALRKHRGRVVKELGDGFIAEFASVVDAVACAVAVQRTLVERALSGPVGRRIELRIGINLGDVVVKSDGDLLGDGVNIAARLEQLCKPGEITISGTAYDHLQGRIDRAIEYQGERQLKNIARTVRVYRVRPDEQDAPGLPAPGPPAPGLPNRPSIAVLPFTNLSGDPEQDYFADGMVDEITTALSRIRRLFVIARTSSFTYRGRAIDLKQVGRELGVRYILQGSVRRSGGKVRITGQLVDVSNGGQLWADRFDGEIADVFDLQDQVTTSVVGAIAPRLERAEIERSQRVPTGSLDAYDHFLRGMAGIHGWTREANASALASFEQAIDLDPEFAAAHGMAARCYSQRKASGWVTDRTSDVAKAGGLARRAVELGTDDPIALGGAAMVLSYVVGEIETARGLIERALALDPNYAWGWLVSAWIAGWWGEPAVAIEHAGRAMRLSPADPHAFTMRTATASAHFFAEQYGAALAWAEEVAWERPGFLIASAVVAAAAALADRPALAEHAMARLREIEPRMRLGNLHEHWPIRRAEHFARWHEGLRRAGLP